ncbi:hypothetical protein PoB_003410600 [Plakobranchus ocellatus]|uniref:Uncharacterized protein n=1 Tax=Plakobranchus ocellatus TaxID=259542 RepID=A0AAV4A8T0_9GAST|nr:hypothetical protein PoB_003410600 [Plakobranchus ocellatus]
MVTVDFKIRPLSIAPRVSQQMIEEDQEVKEGEKVGGKGHNGGGLFCLQPIHNKVISDFQALCKARAPVARCEAQTCESGISAVSGHVAL